MTLEAIRSLNVVSEYTAFRILRRTRFMPTLVLRTGGTRRRTVRA